MQTFMTNSTVFDADIHYYCNSTVFDADIHDPLKETSMAHCI